MPSSTNTAPKPIVVGQEREARPLLPLRTRLQTFPSYSSAIRYLSPPSLFENRPCYRLLSVSLSGHAQAHLRFGQSCYFDKIDVSEELGHELSSATINSTPSWPELPFRSLVSDPFDLVLRTVNTSITTLTIRHEPASGEARFSYPVETRKKWRQGRRIRSRSGRRISAGQRFSRQLTVRSKYLAKYRTRVQRRISRTAGA